MARSQTSYKKAQRKGKADREERVDKSKGNSNVFPPLTITAGSHFDFSVIAQIKMV